VRRRTTPQGVDASEQFREDERLNQIIVRADFQALDTVVNSTDGCEKNGGRLDAGVRMALMTDKPSRPGIIRSTTSTS
jgi:hypothetical protein